MLICKVGYAGKSIGGVYMIEREFLITPSFAEDHIIEKGTKVVISYKSNGYTVGEVLDVREEDIPLKDAMKKDYIIDIVDFSAAKRFEKIRHEYRLFQDIADAVKRYKDYSDYSCDMSLESRYDIGSVEQSVILHFGSPLDPTSIFWDTFNKEPLEIDFNNEE